MRLTVDPSPLRSNNNLGCSSGSIKKAAGIYMFGVAIGCTATVIQPSAVAKVANSTTKKDGRIRDERVVRIKYI
jgi:hypothetical protein